MRTRICHILSDVDQSPLIEAHGELLDKRRFDVGFIFMGRTSPQLYQFFEARGYFVRYLPFNGSKRELGASIIRIRKILREFRPDIVHTHMIEASIGGLLAAWSLRFPRRVHTRHHGSEASLYYRRGLIYDRVINLLSHRIVAISPVVRGLLLNTDKVPERRVVTIPHGFQLGGFKADPKVVERLKQQYGLNGHFPVVGSIARFIHWKGVQHTVSAFKQLLKRHPNAKLVLANAVGPYRTEILRLLQAELEKSHYVVIEFEREVFSLYKTFDVFVHVPIRPDLEAFGQVFVESLAMKVPSVFTMAGIASDFVKHGENAMVVDFENPSAIAEAISNLLANPEQRERMVETGFRDVSRLFNEDRFKAQLESLYSELKP